ncbi:MAG: response regulator [Bdellovibrionales bacterium]
MDGNKRLPGVLLVDDNPSDLLIAKAHLGRLDLEVTTALNAEEALAKLRESEFALVVLDMIMPKVSGAQLARQIRGLAKYKTTPILMLSGQSELVQVKEAIVAGANDYLLKPVDPLILQGKISKLLRAGNSNWFLYSFGQTDEKSGSLSLDIELVSINEMGIQIVSDHVFSVGSSIRLGSEFLKLPKSSGILAKVDLSEVKNGRTYTTLSFLALGDQEKKAIRVRCRELWAQSKQENL